MPMYEYECQSCGKRIEALQSFNDPPLTNCNCGDEGALKKMISAPAFQFKGSGWYVTDYADKGKKAKAENGKESMSESDKSDSGKSDSGKSAADTETKEAKSSSKPKASESKSTATSGSGGQAA